MALTEGQINQLNMLTYAGFDEGARQIMGNAARNLMSEAVRTGETVGSYVQKLQQAYGSKAARYQETFDSILSDPALSNMSFSGYLQMEGSGANMVVFTSDSTSESVVAFEGSPSVGDRRENADEARAQHDRIVMDTEVLRSLRRRLGELCDELCACCRNVVTAAETCDSVSFLMTLDMTFRFFLRSCGNLHGTPEEILQNMAQTMKGCCGDLEDLANAMKKLDLLITDCEDDNRRQCQALNQGESPEYT